MHLALRRNYVAEGKMPLDGAQVVTSSASSALFEGIADNGWFFLDWINTPEDVAGMTLERLRAALRCNAAWMLHVEGKSPEGHALALTLLRYSELGLEYTRHIQAVIEKESLAPFDDAQLAIERSNEG